MSDEIARKRSLGAVLRWLGIALAVACVGFLVSRIAAQWSLVGPRVTPRLLAVAAGCTAVYLCSNVCISYGWYRLLLFCGGKPKSQLQCHVVYGTTQIGKYLPGNVFHFVGRQVVGRRAGLSDAALGLSSLLEVALFPAAAALIAVFSGGASQFVRAGVGEEWVWGGIASVVIGLLAAPWALPVLVRKLGLAKLGIEIRPRDVPGLLLPVLAYSTFLLTSCAVLTWLLVETRASDVGFGLVLAVYPVVWVVGFVVPGASGGIGVREALLVLLLGPSLGEPVALTAATVLRGVTLLGELLWFLIARALSPLVAEDPPPPS